jgi:hypothetical protein
MGWVRVALASRLHGSSLARKQGTARSSVVSTNGKYGVAAMSRQSPFGFTFSMLIEIAAVVAIVSYLPRIDLRPSATAADVPQRVNGDSALQVPAALSTIRFSPPERAEAAPRETSFYQPRLLTSPETAPSAPRQSSREAPPLIAVDADRSTSRSTSIGPASSSSIRSVQPWPMLLRPCSTSRRDRRRRRWQPRA